MEKAKKVYIISRFRARTKWEVEFNKNVARYFAKQIVYEKKRPIVPHLFYTQFLDDNKEAEREIGLLYGQLDLTECDEFLLVVVDGYISEGMREEIAIVSRMGIQGRIVTLTKQEMLEQMKVVV